MKTVLAGTLPKCAKCGGKNRVEQDERRIVCINCGAEKYYGLPQAPAQIINQFWISTLVEPAKKYQLTRPGAAIQLGGGTVSYYDSGCKYAPKCQECPLKKCRKPSG